MAIISLPTNDFAVPGFWVSKQIAEEQLRGGVENNFWQMGLKVDRAHEPAQQQYHMAIKLASVTSRS